MLLPFWAPLRIRMEHMIASHLTPVFEKISNSDEKIAELQYAKNIHSHELNVLRSEIHAARHMIYAPDPSLQASNDDAPFMEHSNCQASDFFHPRYIQLCKLIDQRPRLHRKQWEFIYVLHKLLCSKVLQPEARGLVFGVGREPLPAVFAAMNIYITATDAPLDLTVTTDWSNSDQHSSSVTGLLHPNIVPDDKLRKYVTYDFCDMNAIDDKFNNYDFNWSSCCFEHLGSLEAGIQFVINAVEKTLKIGGVAVHTTEYNISSNVDTVETGGTVIFRRKDIDELVCRLRERGHQVDEFTVGPTAHALDFHVDVPPYSGDVHLKLQLASYVTTSVGLTIRRGR